MIILGIETSTLLSSVVLWGPDGRIDGAEREGRSHVEFVAPAVHDLLARNGMAPDGVDGFVVGVGPGLFTGMRVGIASAKALAWATGRPIVGVSSLDLLAHAVREIDAEVCACLDAKRGQVFIARYRAGERLDDPRAVDPAEIPDGLLLVGHDPGTGHEVVAAQPTADALCQIARPLLAEGRGTPVAQLEPMYLRRAEAEIKWEERGVSIERPLRVKPAKRVIEAAGGEGR